MLLRIKKIWLKCDELSKLCHGHGLKKPNLLKTTNSFIFFCSRKRNQGCVIEGINCFVNRYFGVYLSINLLIKRENGINIFHIIFILIEVLKTLVVQLLLIKLVDYFYFWSNGNSWRTPITYSEKPHFNQRVRNREWNLDSFSAGPTLIRKSPQWNDKSWYFHFT